MIKFQKHFWGPSSEKKNRPDRNFILGPDPKPETQKPTNAARSQGFRFSKQKKNKFLSKINLLYFFFINETPPVMVPSPSDPVTEEENRAVLFYMELPLRDALEKILTEMEPTKTIDIMRQLWRGTIMGVINFFFFKNRQKINKNIFFCQKTSKPNDRSCRIFLEKLLSSPPPRPCASFLFGGKIFFFSFKFSEKMSNFFSMNPAVKTFRNCSAMNSLQNFRKFLRSISLNKKKINIFSENSKKKKTFCHQTKRWHRGEGTQPFFQKNPTWPFVGFWRLFFAEFHRLQSFFFWKSIFFAEFSAYFNFFLNSTFFVVFFTNHSK